MVTRGPGLPDEDAPHDPASTRYWVSTSYTSTERDRVTVSSAAETSVAATPNAVMGLLAPPNDPAPLAIGDGPTTAAAAAPPSAPAVPSAADALALHNVGGPGSNAPKKGKGKAKAKPKADPAAPKTKADRRTECRALA